LPGTSPAICSRESSLNKSYNKRVLKLSRR
jgi:hypothetical protein